MYFATSVEAKKAGQFSRRNHTSEEMEYARAVFKNWEKVEVPESSRERQMTRESRSAEEQYALLDSRLGKGTGARKERRKLLLLLGWSQQMIDAEFPLHNKK